MSINNNTICKVVAAAAIVTSASLVGDVVTANAENNSGIVNVSALNVRSGPGTNNRIITKLYRNNKVSILESSNGWHKVQLSNGTIGWSSAEYISTSTNGDASTSGSKVGVITTSTLNVRSGVGTNYSIIGKVYKGNQVNIQETQSGWHKITLSNGSIGWVSGDYVKTSSGGNSSNVNQGNSENQLSNKVGVVNTSSLNVRKGAGTNYSVIRSIKYGQKVTVTASLNGWYKITLSDGNQGWVSGQYLNVSDGSIGSGENTNSGSQTNNVASNAVAVAKAQLGKPYGWGAEGPNSYDCSGLTYYAYKQQGITLPRTSSSQGSAGWKVSKNDLVPGDLVFFNTNGSGISHVGIYIGDGNMIHSTKPGDVVKVTSIHSSYYASRFVTARRVA